ncbi:MAG: DNA primase [Bacilli bacterium]|nr:DNA primase [Bacilli bacterium]
MISDEIIEQIKKKIDIVDVISSYIPLTKKGRNYFGLCPFHDDHSPSMSVSKEKGIYTCFVCGATGNAITFVMNYENVSYLEALKILGEKLGINLNLNTYKKKDNYDHLYEIYEFSNKFYQNNLNTIAGHEARDYLKNRGINEDIIKEFKVGLALGFDKSLTKLLIQKGYKEQDLIDIGLTNKNDYGYQDLFLNRIMFPLWNTEGKIIGYSGRIYNQTDTSKYINTKETVIFKKGLNLYNYHRARNAVRMSGSIIIMEGFMDVIRAHSVGIYNVVATMGTALTIEQANLIKKLSHNVILCFDGDKAGNKATFACGNELVNIGINPKVVRLESNLDPDEYIIKFGVKKFQEKLDNCISFLDFKMNYYKEGKNLNNNEDLSNYVNEIILEVKNIEDEILRELTLKKISGEIGISFETLMSKLFNELNNDTKALIGQTIGNVDENIEDTNPYTYDFKPKKVVKTFRPKVSVTNKYMKAEREILYFMLTDKDLVYKLKSDLPYFPTQICRFLAHEIMYFVEKYDTIASSDFLNYLNSKTELVNLVGEILDSNDKKKYSIEEIPDCINVLKNYNLKNEIDRLNALLKTESDLEKKIELANRIMSLKMGVEENERNQNV